MNNAGIVKGTVLVAVVLLSNFVSANSFEGCKKYDEDNLDKGKPYQTAFGKLEFYECPVSSQAAPVKSIVLGGNELLSEPKSLWLSNHDKAMGVFIYEGGNNRTSLIGPCTGTQYLLDLRGKKPRMIRFGIKNACNQMDKVTWKEDRVVMHFIRDAKFEYLFSTGKMNLPEDDPSRYDPVFDDNSPVFDQYVGKKKHPHMEYELAPPYAEEVKLNW